MNRYISALSLSLLTACLCFGQNSNLPTNQTSDNAQRSASDSDQGTEPHAVVAAELSRSLDSRKLKQGDPVEAKTTSELRTNNGTVIPRGAKITGHVVEASARAKGGPQSSLRIAFDNITLKGGQLLPVKATLQAIAPPPMGPTGEENPQSMSRPGVGPGGMMTPIGSAAPGTSLPPPTGTPQTDSTQGTQASPALAAQSNGVVGMPNMQMQPDSTLISSGKDLKLDAGTEMILRVQSQ